jgi:hypothetical protein
VLRALAGRNVMKAKIAIAAAIVLFAALARVCGAQTDCGHSGIPVEPVEPVGLSHEQILEKAVANESQFRAQLNRYTCVEEIRIQTLVPAGLPGKYAADGEYWQVMNVAYDASGRRMEQVTFAPQSTLRRVTMTMDDFEDIHTYAAYVITPKELPMYNFRYAGRQHIDELDTYVFDVAPKTIQPKQKYYQGRIWIETRDLAIVKTCGKTVPDVVLPPNKKRGTENIHATYVTYRELIDGNWFPVYTNSDDLLVFRNGSVRMRQVIRYSQHRLKSPALPREPQTSLAPHD